MTKSIRDPLSLRLVTRKRSIRSIRSAHALPLFPASFACLDRLSPLASISLLANLSLLYYFNSTQLALTPSLPVSFPFFTFFTFSLSLLYFLTLHYHKLITHLPPAHTPNSHPMNGHTWQGDTVSCPSHYKYQPGALVALTFSHHLWPVNNDLTSK